MHKTNQALKRQRRLRWESGRWHTTDAQRALRASQPERAPLRILVAEDDEDMRGLIASALRKDGFDVIEAGDGSELMRWLESLQHGARRSEPLDLVISDVRMAGFTGLQALGRLRGVDWAVPVILITAFGDERLHAEAARLGAFTVLDKPFPIDTLRRAISDVWGAAG